MGIKIPTPSATNAEIKLSWLHADRIADRQQCQKTHLKTECKQLHSSFTFLHNSLLNLLKHLVAGLSIRTWGMAKCPPDLTHTLFPIPSLGLQ